ncbi:MAG TPA: EAL domain-containing protein [Sphingomicrobium sp.]|nr:EAL domain-containing protein [Sphingomicrobium sp.]
MLARLMNLYMGVDLSTGAGRALVEERYWSLRRQVPIVFLLGFVNISAMELAGTGRLTFGLNVPTFIACIWVVRLKHWFGRGSGRDADHSEMVKRMRQTVFVAAAVCVAVCARCLYLIHFSDEALQMAMMLFGGLTAIGVAYGLTALPAAGFIPLVLIIGPISAVALLSHEPRFAGAAFALVAAATFTLRLLGAHSRHLSAVIQSRSAIAGEQEVSERAHREAVVAATTDFLTGLPNRRAFVAALEVATAKGSPAAVAILDLNRFKAVNDTFGHAIGDLLLVEVASRLVRSVGKRGLVARLGGDEFGILFHDLRRTRDVAAMGRTILARVSGPVLLNGREFIVTASCGLSIAHKAGQSPSRLMADADVALYQAKEIPGGGAALFEAQMEASRRRRGQIERALQRSDMRANLNLVYQPIFDLTTGRVIAHEALARWTDCELGAVAPSEFVPIAEQLNLIHDINGHLMQMAFATARSWPASIRLSFNLSAIQLCSPGSAAAVLAALEKADLAPDRLQVEVTETALLADFERARANLTRLREAGATIVLDDFGAGYASIGYLRELKFDQIKLDGGLVTAAQHSEDGKRLLRAVIGLCEILGVSSVAEHVESRELLMLVQELGCAAGQGFWLEKPLPAERLNTLYGGQLAIDDGRHARRAA